MILSHKFDSAVKRVYQGIAGVSAAIGVVALAGPVSGPLDTAVVVVASTVFVADVALGVAQQTGLLEDVSPVAATAGAKPLAEVVKAAQEATAVATAVEAVAKPATAAAPAVVVVDKPAAR